MLRWFVFLFFLLSAAAWAGDSGPVTPGPRQEFRQRKTYPYIFEPVPYLENGAPPALRFGESLADCSRHNPPPLPKAAKTNPSPTPLPKADPKASAKSSPEPTPEPQPTPSWTPDPMPAAAPREEPRPVQPAFPPPENAQPVTSENALDMTKYPSEVVDIFKNPYNVPKSRRRVFDPVFEPAQPPPATAPASKASFRQD